MRDDSAGAMIIARPGPHRAAPAMSTRWPAAAVLLCLSDAGGMRGTGSNADADVTRPSAERQAAGGCHDRHEPGWRDLQEPGSDDGGHGDPRSGRRLIKTIGSGCERLGGAGTLGDFTFVGSRCATTVQQDQTRN